MEQHSLVDLANQGYRLYQESQHERCIDVLNTVIEAYDPFALGLGNVYQTRAKALTALDRYPEAIADFSHYIERDTIGTQDPLGPHTLRGLLLLATGQFQGAIQDFSFAMTMDHEGWDDDVHAHSCGMAYEKLRQAERAKKYFEIAKMGPQTQEGKTLFGKGLIRLFSLRRDGARMCFSDMLQWEPDCAAAQHYLGVCALFANAEAAALDYFQKAINLCPSYIKAYQLLSHTCRAKGYESSAQDYHRRADILIQEQFRVRQQMLRGLAS